MPLITMLIAHTYPDSITRTPAITVTTIDGQRHPLIRSTKGAFICFDRIGDESGQLVLEREQGWQGASVKPGRAGASFTIDQTRLIITVTQTRSLLIELPGKFVISLIIKRPCSAPPVPKNGGRLHHFTGREIHNPGHIKLTDNDVLWIDAGTWVRATVLACAAKGVIIGDSGILENPPKSSPNQQHHGTIFDHCAQVSVSGIHMLAQHGWMLSIGNCDDFRVETISQESHNAGTDGIDVVGSRNVIIRGCFLLNSDDNFAIKALDRKTDRDSEMMRGTGFNGNWTANVENILVENCSFFNDHGGSAMEIGYETCCDHMRNIVFRNIDVMAVHTFGSVFGIHTGDRALIQDVLWENIVVEHHYDKLVDFRILHSRWNEDDTRGKVTGVRLKNVTVCRLSTTMATRSA